MPNNHSPSQLPPLKILNQNDSCVLYGLEITWLLHCAVLLKNIKLFDANVHENMFSFRFMPDGIYLNAKDLGPRKLAKIMHKTICRKSRYYKYFRWHHYYSFHYSIESPKSDPICEMCSLFNVLCHRHGTSSYRYITDFWKNN